MMRCLLLLPCLIPPLCSSCSNRMGATFDAATGNMTSFYAASELGTNYDASSIGPVGATTLGQNQTKAFGAAMSAWTAVEAITAARDVQMAERANEGTAIKSAAATDQAAIEAATEREAIKASVEKAGIEAAAGGGG